MIHSPCIPPEHLSESNLILQVCFAFCFYLAKHPGRNTFRPGRVVGTKNRRDDYCGQGLLVLLARQKNTPGRVWQRVLFNCPYGHRKNQTYIAAKHPEHFYVKDNLGSTRAVVDEASEVVEAYDYRSRRNPGLRKIALRRPR
jgi:hypothetical protein